MNQFELYAQQQRVMRDFWSAEKLRLKRENEAEEQRQANLRAVEHTANLARGEGSTLLQAAHTAREKAQAEIHRVSDRIFVPLRLDGRISPSSDTHSQNPKDEIERAVRVVQRVTSELSEAVVALLRHYEDAPKGNSMWVVVVVVWTVIIGCIFLAGLLSQR